MTLQTSPLKRILKLALPVSLQALITSSLSFVDIYMVSSLGESSVAAVGLINKIYFAFIVALFGLSSGVSVLISQYWGSGKKQDVLALLYASLCWAVVVALPLTLIGAFAAPFIAPWLTPDTRVTELTQLYWQWTSPFILLTSISLMFATAQRSTGDSFWPMVASVLALVSNTAMNYIVLFGQIESLRIGLPGVAIATNISRAIEVSLLLYVLVRHLKPTWHWRMARFWQIWHQGKIITLQEGAWSGGMLAFFLIYSYMGPSELAAMSLLSPVESILIDFFIGFGVATSILLGQHLGRGEFEEAWLLQRYILTRFPLIALGMAVVLALMTQSVVSLFGGVSEDVRSLLGGVWLMFCIALPLRTFNMITVIGVLRSGGDNPFVLLVEAISIWLIALPLLAIFGLWLGWPLWAVVGLTVAEEAGKLLIFRQRIHKRFWIRNLTIQEG